MVDLCGAPMPKALLGTSYRLTQISQPPSKLVVTINSILKKRKLRQREGKKKSKFI
jgi:hypothetical protein